MGVRFSSLAPYKKWLKSHFLFTIVHGGLMKPGEQIPFDHVKNFRELGGYAAADGRHVKYGLLFRGPALCGLSESDKKAINDLHIKTVLDFRSKNESDHNPEYVPDSASYFRKCASIDRYGHEIDYSPGTIEKLTHKFITLFRLIRGMITNDVYNAMPFHNKAFQMMFDLLEHQQVPMFFHCAAGKDRTGVAAILILLALGVDRKTALDDYELTNVYYADNIEAVLRRHKLLTAISKTAKYRYSAGAGVQRGVADSMLDLIYERYHTFEAYLEAEYGIDKVRLEHLRDLYLE